MVRIVYANQGMGYRIITAANARVMPVPTKPEQVANARFPTTSSTQQDGSANPVNPIPITPTMTPNAFVTVATSNLGQTAYQHVI